MLVTPHVGRDRPGRANLHAMAMSIMRFNLILPGLEPKTLSDMYRAALDMAEYAEEHGFIDDHARGAPRRRQRVEPVAARHGRR